MPPSPHTFQELVDALGDGVLEARGNLKTPVAGADSDSRRIRPGDCFVAIRGAREDGTRYWPHAREAGAVALVSETPPETDDGAPFARVADSYRAAGRIAELVHGHPANRLRLIGVTGTNGKTTCAFLLERIATAAGRKAGLIGTVQYAFGQRVAEADRTTPMPFDLQKLFRDMADGGAEEVVVEVSSHSLAQGRLGTSACRGGLFTNLTGDHLDFHETMEEYYRAKRRLFTESLAANAPALINIDDPHGERLHCELRKEGSVRPLSFTMTDAEADFRMVQCATSVHGGTAVLQSNLPGAKALDLHTPMIGRYNLCNAGCAAALALALGTEPATVARVVADFHGAPGRLEPIRVPGKPAVFVDYAHTDDALGNVLQALGEVKKARLLVVFGCGGDRDRTKRPRMARVAEALADRVVLTSDNPRTEDPEAILDEVCAGFSPNARFQRFADRGDAIRAALEAADPDDLVLVAGKGHETYQIVNDTKFPFDDAEVVRSILREARA